MIPPISPLTAITPPSAPTGTAAPSTEFSNSVSSAINALDQQATSTGSSSASTEVGKVLDALQQTQATASKDEALAAAGQGNLADTMIAATQASLATEVTSSLLNQATTAYNSIMNLSL